MISTVHAKAYGYALPSLFRVLSELQTKAALFSLFSTLIPVGQGKGRAKESDAEALSTLPRTSFSISPSSRILNSKCVSSLTTPPRQLPSACFNQLNSIG